MKNGAHGTDQARRAFLRGDFLTRAGQEHQECRQYPWGSRPPWHIEGFDADRCYDCAAPCLSVCEPGIIRRYPRDHKYARSVYLDVAEAGCSFCGACVDACPVDIVKAAEHPVLGTARLNKTLCLAWNGVVCVNCRHKCDFNALVLDRRGRVKIDAEACTGCGCCVSVCPTKALKIET